MNPLSIDITDGAAADLENYQEWRQTGTPISFAMEQQSAWLNGTVANTGVATAQAIYRTNDRSEHMQAVFDLAYLRDLLYQSRTAPYLMRVSRCRSGLATPIREQNGVIMAQAEAGV